MQKTLTSNKKSKIFAAAILNAVMRDKFAANYRYTGQKVRLLPMPHLQVGSVYRVADHREDGSYILEEIQIETVLPVWGESIYAEENLVLDPTKRKAFWNGVDIFLSNTEWKLLTFLLRNQDVAIQNYKILAEVWGGSYRSDIQYLRVWVSRLRAKLPTLPLETVPGYGYRLEPPNGQEKEIQAPV